MVIPRVADGSACAQRITSMIKTAWTALTRPEHTLAKLTSPALRAIH
jgi:hypothetical protein